MENVLLLAAALLAGCAALFSFIRFHAKAVRILWSAAAALILCNLVLMLCYLAGGCFDYSYVYEHTALGLAPAFKISALWSGQEGSFLLWAAIMAVIGFPALGKKPGRSFGVYALLGLGIFLMCFVSQPFARQFPVPADGLGMTSALQDPWMVIHPPLVFVAYCAMGLLAAMAVTKEKSAGIKMRKWLRFSWVFLGLGIFTGSIWAYRALGWGGYWSWDPIENAAFIPWLILCANLHGRIRLSRAGCVLPFLAACCGTFLARSGILQNRSAHAYAQGNTVISVLLLAFVLGALCWLAVLKIQKVKKEKTVVFHFKDDLKNPKRLLYYAFYIYAALIALGTAAPLFFNFEVRADYYATVSILFALACIACILIWDLKTLKTKNIWMMVIGTALTIIISAFAGWADIGWILLLWACLMPLSLWLADGFRSHRLRFYLLHAGFLLLVAGVIVSMGMGKELTAFSNAASGVYVDGLYIPLSSLSGDLVLFRPAGDIIIHSANILPVLDALIIPYQTRPFIFLFWAGGFIVLLGPWAAGAPARLLNHFKKNKKKLFY